MGTAELVAIISVAISGLLAITAIMSGIRSGVITKLKLGNLIEFHGVPSARPGAGLPVGSDDSTDIQMIPASLVPASNNQDEGREGKVISTSQGLAHVDTNNTTQSFEVQQLSRYYAQVLSQSQISFWFSLIFASLGFAMIAAAVFSANMSAMIIQSVAGIIMDAVAALFFVQSKRAQLSMAEFFDKLRRDRDALEARKICDAIENRAARDILKIRLSLHAVGIQSQVDIAQIATERLWQANVPVQE